MKFIAIYRDTNMYVYINLNEIKQIIQIGKRYEFRLFSGEILTTETQLLEEHCDIRSLLRFIENLDETIYEIV